MGRDPKDRPHRRGRERRAELRDSPRWTATAGRTGRVRERRHRGTVAPARPPSRRPERRAGGCTPAADETLRCSKRNLAAANGVQPRNGHVIGRHRPPASSTTRRSAVSIQRAGGAAVTLCHGGARELRGGSGPAEAPKGRRSADKAAKPSRHSRPARCLYHAKPRAPALQAGRHHAHDPRASEITRGRPVNGRGEVAGLALRLTLSRVDASRAPLRGQCPRPAEGRGCPNSEFHPSGAAAGGPGRCRVKVRRLRNLQ